MTAPDLAVVAARRQVLEDALQLVAPIAALHPLEPYRVNTTPAGPLSSPAGHTTTAAEHHVALALDVAGWLLGAE